MELRRNDTMTMCPDSPAGHADTRQTMDDAGAPRPPSSNHHGGNLTNRVAIGPELARELAAEHERDLTVYEAPAMATPIEPELRGWARLEAKLERLAHKHRFWQKVLSRIWLPLAAHSGLTMKKLDPHTFTAVLPFRRFNRNFYNAMAGAALLANSEIAAGMYLFGELKGKWTVVCKELNYRFLRPCFGPAIYRVAAVENLDAKLASGDEFNIDVVLEILQHVPTPGRRPRKVGRCEATFHCTPKTAEGNRRLKRRLLRRLKG